MRKISLMAISVAALFAGACTTNVVVDSRAFPMASYDEISGSFTGKLAGNINSAFKSANIALERDLKYFRVGQIPVSLHRKSGNCLTYKYQNHHIF